MSEHDRFDEWMARAAREHNPPPPAPREAMWARIEGARKTTRAGEGAIGGVVGHEPGIGSARREPRLGALARRWIPIGAGIAAALVLGFGVGRWSGGAGSGDGRIAAETQRAAPDAGLAPAGTDTPAPAPASAPDSAAAEGPAPAAPDVAPREDRRLAGQGAGAPRLAAGGPRPVTRGPQPAALDPRPSSAYSVAAAQHLARAEVLLTSFRADLRSGRTVDAQLSAWAGDLLASTRLLLDSPAADEPRVRALLADLELVLAQLAHLEPGRGGEADIIDRAVEGRNVLPRLRTTIPAGRRPAGS
jgi:hypothetical protein